MFVVTVLMLAELGAHAAYDCWAFHWLGTVVQGIRRKVTFKYRNKIHKKYTSVLLKALKGILASNAARHLCATVHRLTLELPAVQCIIQALEKFPPWTFSWLNNQLVTTATESTMPLLNYTGGHLHL